MSLFTLPTGRGLGSLDTDIVRRIELDGTSYDLRFRWNTRDESWTLILSVSGSTPVFNTKTTVGRVLNTAYKYRDNAPQGDMIILDMAEDGGRVDFENYTIDGRYRLFYITDLS